MAGTQMAANQVQSGGGNMESRAEKSAVVVGPSLPRAHNELGISETVFRASRIHFGGIALPQPSDAEPASKVQKGS